MLSAAEEEEPGEEVAKAVLEAAAEAVAALNRVREREGAVTAEEMRQRCRNICGLVARMEEIRAGAVSGLPEAPAGEVGGSAARRRASSRSVSPRKPPCWPTAAISPRNLMRLRTHAAQLDAMLDGEGEIGKRLDFLLQEMNRESNTVLSKTGGLGDLGLTITDLALAAKSEIDKIREQSLNLE